MTSLLAVILIGAALVGGVAVGILLRRMVFEARLESLDSISQKMIEDAHKEAKNLKREAELQAKDRAYQMKQEFETETRERKQEYLDMERGLLQREAAADKKTESLDTRERDMERRAASLHEKEEGLETRKAECDDLVQQCRLELEKLAGMSANEAKESLVKAMEAEAKHDAAKLIKRVETEARETADRKSKDIIAQAIKRYAGDYVAEQTVSVVHLPSEDMKGRIIGREGRNIRALEAATGIDLIIDDTPEAVILSGFNPIRREVARISLERLITDGRIHPARIEEVVGKVESEIDGQIREVGEQAAFDLGVHGIHPEIIKLLGRLKYRTSYAQNVLQHSLEVGALCGIMAAELGLNQKQAKRAGLLHDIGKAIDHEVEGPHAVIGADQARKFGESPRIVHCIAAHHEDIPPNTILSVLVQAADSLSGARPGARREMLESYIKRLQDLERIATSFKGVEKSYAIQAGREVRIIVEANKVDDDDAIMIAREVARKVEDELMYPGQIRITVIRETRAIEYAK